MTPKVSTVHKLERTIRYQDPLGIIIQRQARLVQLQLASMPHTNSLKVTLSLQEVLRELQSLEELR